MSPHSPTPRNAARIVSHELRQQLVENPGERVDCSGFFSMAVTVSCQPFSQVLQSSQSDLVLKRSPTPADRSASHRPASAFCLDLVAIGHAAMDAAIANYPDQRFTLRNGILVIRRHPRT